MGWGGGGIFYFSDRESCPFHNWLHSADTDSDSNTNSLAGKLHLFQLSLPLGKRAIQVSRAKFQESNHQHTWSHFHAFQIKIFNRGGGNERKTAVCVFIIIYSIYLVLFILFQLIEPVCASLVSSPVCLDK